MREASRKATWIKPASPLSWQMRSPASTRNRDTPPRAKEKGRQTPKQNHSAQRQGPHHSSH